MIKFAKQLVAGEDGATMVEYALMVALIGAALISVVTLLSGAISTSFTNTTTKITGS
jgi:pilus assembly protein Flp/PilA